MKKSKKRQARTVIDKASQMEGVGGPEDEKRFNTEIGSGLYRLVYMVYVPENPNGRGELRFDLPSKREYKRVRRQLHRKVLNVWFYNEYGERHYVNVMAPSVISVTLEKVEVKPTPKVEGEKQKGDIVLPDQRTISAINKNRH